MQVQRHMLLPQREAMHHQSSSSTTITSNVRREQYQVSHQPGQITSMPEPTRKSSLQSTSVAAAVSSFVSATTSKINAGQRSDSTQLSNVKSYEKTSKYSVSSNNGNSSGDLPGKPEAEPFNIRMNYIDESGFVDVNVDRIADQLSGLSVADNGVRSSTSRPVSSSPSTVTHLLTSMPEPQIYRDHATSSSGARASSLSVRKTVVDYKTRQEHKALIETLLKRISVLFQKQKGKSNVFAIKQDDTSSHWQLLDTYGESGTSQEVN
jgi:hypothetical protein